MTLDLISELGRHTFNISYMKIKSLLSVCFCVPHTSVYVMLKFKKGIFIALIYQTCFYVLLQHSLLTSNEKELTLVKCTFNVEINLCTC